MSAAAVTDLPTGGFSFRNVARNASLAEMGFPAPLALKTGTTIAGLVIKDGVVLGADTRATGGSIVADKDCEKLHDMGPNMCCAGAGTAADLQFTARNIKAQLELLSLNTGRPCLVKTANTLLQQMLFKYQGHVGAALVLGGVDKLGGHIFNIYPHGSTSRLPYATMGSGSLAAMALIEAGWKQDMTEQEGIQLIRDGIHAGITNDLGSGSNVDICVIKMDEAGGPPIKRMMRTYEVVGIRGKKEGQYNIRVGSTAVLKTEVIPIKIEEEEVITTMETD